MCELPGTEIRDVVTGKGHEPSSQRFCTVHAAQVDTALAAGSGPSLFARTGPVRDVPSDPRIHWIGVAGGVLVAIVCVLRGVAEGPAWLLPAAIATLAAVLEYRIATRPRPPA